MSEPQLQSGEDPLTRDLTRAALRAYMRAHKIGVPALKDRIETADPRRREIPLSTLQRFIAGTHETSPHHVALCHSFVKELPYYGQDAALLQIGAGLVAFLAIEPPPQSRAPGGPLSQEDFAGDFEVLLLDAGAPPLLPGQDAPAAGRTRIRRALAQDYFVIEETLFAQPSGAAGVRRYTYDGVAVLRDSQAHILLRSALTGAPRVYALSRYDHPDFSAEDAVLTGESFEAAPAPGARAHGSIQLTRIAMPEAVL